MRLNNIYPGVSAVFTTSALTFPPTTLGQGKIILTLQPGADLDRFRLRILNTGAIPFQGPGGVWFTGGIVPGVFIASVQTTQVDGGMLIPIASDLKIESSEATLSVEAPSRNPALSTEVVITFPDYDINGNSFPTEKASDGNRYFASSVERRTDFGVDGKLDSPACNGTCTDAILARIDASGNVIWVSLAGGEGQDVFNFAALSTSGVVASGNTTSQGFPVTSNAPQSTLRSTRDAFLAVFDRDTGQLRNSTYAGVEGPAFVSSFAVDSGGDLAIGGGYDTGASTGPSLGYLIRWRPSENRFVFSLRLDAPVANLVFDSKSNLYYASTDVSLPIPRMQTGVLDANGQPQGSVVTVDAPAGSGDALILGIRLLPGTDGEYWVAYELTKKTPGSPTVLLARVSSARGQVVFTLRITGGTLAGFAFTSAGNVKLLVTFPFLTEVTSADAALVAGCGDTPYFAIFSPSGQMVYASYVPATFDFASQNEIQSPAPASVVCFVSTAGRVPTTLAAPGQLITITGGAFGPSSTIYSSLDTNSMYPLALAGLRVRIGGLDAPIIAAARGVVAAQVPFELVQPIGFGSIEVFDNGMPLNSVPFTFSGHVLALFDTGDRNNSLGLPALAALNQDGTVNSESNPASDGSIVSVFGSGLGTLSPALTTGGINPIPPAAALSQSSLLNTAWGGQVLYLGSAPGLSDSVVQANVRLSVDQGVTGVHPHGLAIAVSESIRTLFAFGPTGVVFVK
jgi:uncharacterized protein (TIGR03437 family)